MESIQKFLGITPFLNYTRTLRWESMTQGRMTLGEMGKPVDHVCLEEKQIYLSCKERRVSLWAGRNSSAHLWGLDFFSITSWPFPV